MRESDQRDRGLVSLGSATRNRWGRWWLAASLGTALVLARRRVPCFSTVHIYGVGSATAPPGLVEVAEDPGHPWGLGTCGAVVMGDCIEP